MNSDLLKTPKKLWILVVVLVILYLLTQYLANYNLQTREPFDAILFGIDVYGFLLTGFVLGLLLGVLIAFIPFRQKSFAEKFNITFPLLTAIVLLLWIVFLGYFGYLVHVRGDEMRPLRKYDDIQISKSLDCSSVQNGKFQLDDILIERQAERQIQINTKTGERTKFFVEWINGCEYILKRQTGEGEKLRVKITSVNPESYSCYVISGDDLDKYARFYTIIRVQPKE